MTQSDVEHTAGDGVFSRRISWWLLAAAYVAITLVFSVIQPLGRTPDESPHMRYVAFIAENHRLPEWEPQGGGEAGYEGQHPPFYYGLMAVIYTMSGALEERWRWHVVRWATIGLGCALFAVCSRLFRRVLPEQPGLAWTATATTMLMPLTVLYTGYANPDMLTQLCCAVALWLAVETALAPPHIGRAVLLGLAVGLGCLTKVSAAPAVLVALLAYRLQWQGSRSLAPIKSGALTLGVAAACCGWWYVRNAVSYGSPFIHSTGVYLSAFVTGAAVPEGFRPYVWLTVRETYLSTWIQRGWLPAGWPEIVLYGLTGLATLAALAGLLWRTHSRWAASEERSDLDVAIHLGGWLLLGVAAGHQWAYWFVDVSFNAGGRYILVAMPMVALAIVTGASTLLRGRWLAIALAVWLIGLLTMNAASAYNILTVLNPRYAPGWDFFHFPPS